MCVRVISWHFSERVFLLLAITHSGMFDFMRKPIILIFRD